jgi:very-short-patch-repair endonuclease
VNKTASKTWKDQFTKSLKKWVELKDNIKDAGDVKHYMGSSDNLIKNIIPMQRKDDEILLAGFRALLYKKLNDMFCDIDGTIVECQSTIEWAMFMALTIAALEIADNVIFIVQGREYFGEDKGTTIIKIEPQAEMGEYRVDFLLTHKELVPDFDNPMKLSDGREIPGSKYEVREIIVECDGHEYHERTKEQARRDKQRDRALQSLGFIVFHYTGSEIWEDVFKCAQEVMRKLSE